MLNELWYVSCSPRNPAKIRNEVKLLSKLSGKVWNKGEAGNKITQLKFANLLKSSPDFEGNISRNDPAFSARDRVAPMKTYGFAFVDNDGKIQITKAGKALIHGENENDVFLMQMLKWQYPSYQHRGKEYETQKKSNNSNRVSGFSIFPFIFTLQIARRIEGLSKREIAMFLLPQKTMKNVGKVIESITAYRKQRDKKRGRVSKKRYDVKEHTRIFSNLYKERLKLEKRSARKEELNKKVRNSLDVSDACLRLFCHTGLFTIEGKRIKCNPHKEIEIKTILKCARKWSLNHSYDDPEEYYKYFGDPSFPILPFNQKGFLITKILRTQKQVKRDCQIGSHIIRKFYSRSILLKFSVSKLLKIRDTLSEKFKVANSHNYEAYLQSESGEKDIINKFADITDYKEEIIDPASYFEWNTWRAFISIDRAKKVINNFALDDNMNPCNCAGGNKPDMVAEFDEFVVPVEVTLSSGRRQYSTETEPVTYHVGRIKAEENRNQRRKVIGVFIAPKLNIHTVNYFFQYINLLKVPDFGFVTIIPFDLQTFLNIFQISQKANRLNSHQLYDLLNNIEKESSKVDSAIKWLATIQHQINIWEKKVTQK